MVCRVLTSRPSSGPLMVASALETAFRHELVDPSTQVSMTPEKPASLPPMVRLTSVVPGRSADTWLPVTSAVVAPAQATETNEPGAFTPAHCSGYALVLRSQLPLEEI
jgi:hypothetical protein